MFKNTLNMVCRFCEEQGVNMWNSYSLSNVYNAAIRKTRHIRFGGFLNTKSILPMNDSTNTTETQASGLEFTEASESREFLKQEFDKKQKQLAELKIDCDPLERTE